MNKAVQNLELGLVGNCSYGALIDKMGNIVWACMPQFDSDPVFCSLLKGDTEPEGAFKVELHDFTHSTQAYIRNTPALVTVLHDRHGGVVEITDFAPRFRQFGRIFRPIMLIRHIKPLGGNPVIRIRLRPQYDYGGGKPDITRGSNHIRYVSPQWVLRLTTDASISAILDETTFVLDDGLTMILGPDETIPEAVTPFGHRFLEETLTYWRDWSRTLAIPFEWQDEVVRSAITLKLNAYEDTGAIVAAMTTSIPESANSSRNWDYRYCWLRDGYFVTNALNRLGKTETMERYLRYIINVSTGQKDNNLRPVYRINGKRDLTEKNIKSLPGYRDMGPVRIGNQACEQIQNDVFGSAILATTHVFFDRRLDRPGDEGLFYVIEKLGEKAISIYDQPDAGLWEFRQEKKINTHSSVMCWVACDRLAKIATHLKLDKRQQYWRTVADKIHGHITERAWNKKLNSFVDTFDGEDVDSGLLLLEDLGFLSASDPRFASTVAIIENRLKQGDFLFRYINQDDFGKPENAFIICTFWYIDALTSLGRIEEARDLFEKLLGCTNHLGLLSEHIDPSTHELWGNFPQTYSMVGIINSAIRLSKSWEDVF
jgi:GH15 family glucan-1,4-alpha-glucosidase